MLDEKIIFKSFFLKMNSANWKMCFNLVLEEMTNLTVNILPRKVKTLHSFRSHISSNFTVTTMPIMSDFLQYVKNKIV